MTLTKIKHGRQQWPVGHGFFHTAFIEIGGCTYRYAYDCGAGKKDTVHEQIDRYATNESLENRGMDIDMLVISHFHSDHINGVPYFLNKFKVKKLVLPHLSEDAKLVALAQLVSRGLEVWDEFSGLVLDPEQWVKRYSQETEIVEISDEDGERFDLPPEQRMGDGVSIGKGTVNHSSPGTIYQSNRPFWKFKFYVQQSSGVTAAIIRAISKEIPEANKSNLIKWLSDPDWISHNWPAIADAFKKLGSAKQNSTTLSMYSGPIDLRYISPYSFTKAGRRMSYRSWRHHYSWPGIGWLGTGDAELKALSKFTDFENHFGELLLTVDTVTLPHHGSIDNYNAKLGDLGFCHVVTANDLVDPKGYHPSVTVMTNLKMKSSCVCVVSLKKNTELFQYFDAELDFS